MFSFSIREANIKALLADTIAKKKKTHTTKNKLQDFLII